MNHRKTKSSKTASAIPHPRKKSPLKSKEKFATQKSIAAHLNISRTTVAEIIGGRAAHRYNAETRRKVLEAAKHLNYRPDRSAQAIRRGRSNLIGIIHFGGAYEVSRQMRYYLAQAVHAHGYDVSITESNNLYDQQGHGTIERLLASRVEGIIISHSIEAFGIEEIQILKSAGIPLVTLSGQEEWHIPTVDTDIRGAMRRMVRHLVQIGHKKLLLLTNRYNARTTTGRIQGFIDGIAPYADPARSLSRTQEPVTGSIARVDADRGSFDMATPAYRLMKHLIAHHPLPDAVVCHNDHWARGVYAAACEAGLRIPEDLAVTGFDNESFGAYAPFELTTASSPIPDEAEKTVEMMVDLIRQKKLLQHHYTFPCELIVRRSCGTPQKEKRPCFLPQAPLLPHDISLHSCMEHPPFPLIPKL